MMVEVVATINQLMKVRPDFNYNIDPFSINPRLNFKNIASIIYLQEFLDKKARGEDPNLEADINYRDQLGNLDIFGNLGRSGNIVGANMHLFLNQVLLV
jgi:hypothetical protein